MKRINIITADSKAGLGRDVKILDSLLKEAGFSVMVYILGEKTVGHKIQRITTYINRFASYTLKSKPPYDINLFLEYVEPSWFPYASVNCLIPNQEWFREDWHPYLEKFDYILCKTRFAENIFNKLGCKTEFISFTSLDCFNEKYPKDYDAFLHLASSWQKGTKTILEVWKRHPEWPRLTIKQKQNSSTKITAPNIEYITKYLDDEVLCQYQNSHGIHLCPSEAEGFGHYIVEAMSCQAVTLTTNAPPMNQVITPNRGILVDYHDSKIHRLGTNYYVNPQSLEQKINEILGMDYNSKKQLGENARDWYQQNDSFFRRKLIEVLGNL
ncbi:glycosyltransferase [Limnofasciculus baicalensis]|uniref:Glycosyltransferase n=1 Tax=Limnofasciculus baicalensis BBK-W-15 TaxID=2699891 RepID=A0AAE3KLN8_9CYAN|nr:glycosyltransferase [Limnofasciculus baicalensis]MCP2728294.1 glycosyltransferase [Limnofasciculus baicalensis BBK-W-15]